MPGGWAKPRRKHKTELSPYKIMRTIRSPLSAGLTLVLASMLPPGAEARAEAPELAIHHAVELNWSGAADTRYRLYRSVGDLEHFFPLGEPVAGTGGEMQLFDSTQGTEQAFYKLSVVAPAATEAEILQAHEEFRAAVNAHDAEALAPFFLPDVVFDDPAQPPLKNRDETLGFFTKLYGSFPDYFDSGGISRVRGNIFVGEHASQGTHLGDWDLGALGVVPPTGEVVSMPHMGVYEYEGDKMLRFTLYYDLMPMLVQIGVLPAPELPPLVPSIEMPAPNPTGLSPMETVNETTTRWNASDLAGYIEAFAEDADLSLPGFPPGMTRSEYAAAQEGYFTAFPNHHMTAEHSFDMGEGWVMTQARWEGRHTGPYMGNPASGNPVMLRGAILARVDETGLVTYFHVMFDNLTLMAQMGLLAPPPDLGVINAALGASMEAHDPDQFVSFFTPDGTCRYVSGMPQPIPVVPNFHAWLAGLFHAFPDYDVIDEEVWIEGNIVVTEHTTTGTFVNDWGDLPATGTAGHPHKHLDVWDYQGDKVKHLVTYDDTHSLLAAVGLMPPLELPPLVPSLIMPAPAPSDLEPVEVVRQSQDLWNAHDLAGYAGLLADDASLYVAILETALDRNAFIALQEIRMQGFPDLHAEIQHNIDLGEGWVISELTFVGTQNGEYLGVPPSGKSIAVPGAVLYHVNDAGLIDDLRVYWDDVTQLAQLGLLP